MNKNIGSVEFQTLINDCLTFNIFLHAFLLFIPKKNPPDDRICCKSSQTIFFLFYGFWKKMMNFQYWRLKNLMTFLELFK